MKQYLYRIRPTRPDMLSDGATETEEAVVAQHFAFLKELLEKGRLILAGRTLNTDPSSFGIVVFTAEDEGDAKSTLENDPAVKNGVMTGELFPYRVALYQTAQE